MQFPELGPRPPSRDQPDPLGAAQRIIRRPLWLLPLAVAIVSAGAGTWLWAQMPSPLLGPPPAFGQLRSSPPNIVFNSPTVVTFTIRIDAPTLNPTTVEIQRVTEGGQFLATLTRMFDNGKSGD